MSRNEKIDLAQLTKWGNREPVGIKLTDKLITFLFETLNIEESRKKTFTKKKSLEEMLSQVVLPQEFINQLIKLLGRENVSQTPIDRFGNSFGRSYLDLIYARTHSLPHTCQLVVFPKTHEEVLEIVRLANKFTVHLTIYAGGSSVIQGVEPDDRTVVISLKKMNKILEVNPEAQYARVQTGIYGPDLEEELKKHGLTLGHTPQSFEYSCLGGWIACRGAGQQSTLYGKIEEMVLGLKVVTGAGETLETKQAPARSTGPDLNNIFIGSEGTLGIITEAVVRLHRLPEAMKPLSFMFRDFQSGLAAYREIMQSHLRPSVFRLSDGEETYFNIKSSELMKEKLGFSDKVTNLFMKYLEKKGYHEKEQSLGIMIFEGPTDLVKTSIKKAKKICKSFGGYSLGSSPGQKWYETRYELPFFRDPFVDYGILTDTLETATTWDKLENLWKNVRKVLKEECGCEIVWTHLSHAYSSGANLYFTFVTKQEPDNEINQFLEIKKKVLETFLASGGVLSHHHGIGRSFSPWLAQEIGQPGLKLLKAMKQSLDPNCILNPGVLALSCNEQGKK